MAIKARPIHNRIFVRLDDPKAQTKSGLWLPESGQTAKRTGEVLAVGPGMEDQKTGKFVPTTLKVGDHVLVGAYAGTEIKIDGEPIRVLRETDVVALVDGDTDNIETAGVGQRRHANHPFYQ